jgi:predicted nucleic acid-binding protein
VQIAIDTSAVLAVVLNEPHRKQLVEMTRKSDLIAPESLNLEVANAFSAMFKRKRISLKVAILAVREYQTIPIRLFAVDLEAALELSAALNIYAFDAFVIACALRQGCPICLPR